MSLTFLIAFSFVFVVPSILVATGLFNDVRRSGWPRTIIMFMCIVQMLLGIFLEFKFASEAIKSRGAENYGAMLLFLGGVAIMCVHLVVLLSVLKLNKGSQLKVSIALRWLSMILFALALSVFVGGCVVSR